MYKFRGELGVQLAIIAMMKAGIMVYRPIVDTTPDFLIELDGKFLKVEMKTSTHCRGNDNVRIYGLSKTIHSNSRMSSVKYGDGEVDLFCLWSPGFSSEICFVDYNYISGKEITIDYSPTKPTRHNVNWYRDFSFDEMVNG